MIADNGDSENWPGGRSISSCVSQKTVVLQLLAQVLKHRWCVLVEYWDWILYHYIVYHYIIYIIYHYFIYHISLSSTGGMLVDLRVVYNIMRLTPSSCCLRLPTCTPQWAYIFKADL